MCTADYSYEKLEEMAKFLKSKISISPKIGIICGSGLGTLCSLVKEQVVIKYSDIKNFPQSTVEGHQGNLVFGILGDKQVVCLQGRFHPYEGYSPLKCSIPVRVMKLLGVKTLILTNASGGVNPLYNVGDICIIKDHINFPGLAGFNPLVGPNDPRFGTRFPSLTNAYDKELRKLARKVADEGKIETVHSGIYFMQFGPAYETIAEIKMAQTMGADLVGMSTTHEVITAQHCGIKCLALSLVSNKAITDYDTENFPNHEEVLETGRIRSEVVKNYVIEIIKQLKVE